MFTETLETAEEQFDALLSASKYPLSAFIEKHSSVIDRFISAVAKGINKRSEDLVLDPYGPFIDMLRRWATKYKASKNIPKTKIKLGGKILLRGDETEEEDTEEFFAGLTNPPTPSPPPKVPTERTVATLGDFAKAYVFRYPLFEDVNSPMTEDSFYLNYLRYVYEQSRNPSESLQSIVSRIGIMFVPLPFDTAVINEVPQKFNFKEFFLSNGVRFAKTTIKPVAPPEPITPPAAPAKAEYPPELLEILKELLDESTDGFEAEEFVSEYEYTILPRRYSQYFFGPDLIYGIGQSMQRLREAFKFTRTNDELFVDFLNDEQWRDLFIGLVIGVISLQQKISSFNSSQSVIRMIQSNVELTVGKFSTFKRFHRTQPQVRRSINF